MEFVFNLLSQQSVIAIFQLLLGKYLKNNPVIPNTVIPIFTFFAAVLGYNLLPVAAQAADVISKTVAVQGAGVFALALFQTLLVTGTHSTLKNTVVPALKVALGWLSSALNKPAA